SEPFEQHGQRIEHLLTFFDHHPAPAIGFGELGSKYSGEGRSEFHCANFACPHLKIVLRSSDKWARSTLHEAGIPRPSPYARDPRKFVGDVVVIGALREFGRYAESTIAFIEIACAFYIFVISSELSVVCTAWAVWACSIFQAIAGMHFLQTTFGIVGV